MKIGIDLDDVVVNFSKSFLNFYNKEYKTNFKIENWNSYWFGDAFGINNQVVKNVTNDFYNSNYFDEMPLIENARKSIDILAKKYDVNVITARPRRWGMKTNDFFKKHFKFIDLDLYHARDNWDNKLKKSKICRNLNINLMIEDSRENSIQCANPNLDSDVYLLNKPWNQENSLPENIIRFNNWERVLEKLNRGLK